MGRTVLAALLTIFLSNALLSAMGIQPAKATLPVHNVDTGLGYARIQDAINAPETMKGHTIQVDPGTYNENVHVTKQLNIYGAGIGKTIVKAADPNASVFEIFKTIWIPIENVTLNGFTITGATGAHTAGILMRNTKHSTITQCAISSNGLGIFLLSSSNNILANLTVTHNGGGIRLNDSSDNIIANITSHSNTKYGISLYYSRNNMIQNSKVYSTFDGVGIGLDFADNTTILDTVSVFAHKLYPGFGLRIYNSSFCTITDSVISYNEGYGIWFTFHSANNTLFHNTFVYNTRQVHFADTYANSWDDGVEGNYWGDYNGTDGNGDGIGDTPYVINGDNVDRYPLMKPPLLGPNMAIAELDVPRDTVGKGYGVNINTTVLNYGNTTQNLTITLQANTTVLFSAGNVTLESTEFIVLTFFWNTTGYAVGRYVIRAAVDPIPGETDIVDNVLVAGKMVCVTTPGDVDADFDVDIFDIVTIAGAYGVSKPDPKYDPVLDINGDLAIDIYDLVIATGNYGAK